MREAEIRDAYARGVLTWEDLREITGLDAATLYAILYDIHNARR